jgi:hypothetical protein
VYVAFLCFTIHVCNIINHGGLTNEGGIENQVLIAGWAWRSKAMWRYGDERDREGKNKTERG